MNESQSKSALRGAATALVVLAAALLALFHSVLPPGRVLFSNDAPLGVLLAQADILWSNFLAYWVDLGWVGSTLPSGTPSFSPLSYAILGPVAFAKIHAVLCLLALGMAAWFFCRQSGFRQTTAVLTGLAAALNSNAVSYACWGLPPKACAMAATLAALGFLQGDHRGLEWWVRSIVAGLFVGVGIMEGADAGAILSLYVAAFIVFREATAPGSAAERLRRGAVRLVVTPLCAAWISAHTLSTLAGTQITGMTGMGGDPASVERQWQFATFGSFPINETVRLLAPGVMGYRMDTPGGGAYWGGVGSDGTPQTRFSGSGEYAGALVLVAGAFAVCCALKKSKSPLPQRERWLALYWAAVALVSLLLAFGRFAPFYRIVFSLPYFSTIRIPMKFLHGMDVALWIVCACGLEAVARGAEGRNWPADSWGARWERWREAAADGERTWMFAGLCALAAMVVAAVVFAASKASVDKYLSAIPFGESEPASSSFAIGEAFLASAVFAASGVSLWLLLAGAFSGSRRNLGWIVVGTILFLDLGRANLPWVRWYDYKVRYQPNAVSDLMKDKPWEHRVTAFLDPVRRAPLVPSQEFAFLHKEWLENLFQSERIQSLDIDQMPRMPELETAYLSALASPNLQMAAQYAEIAGHVAELKPEDRAQLRAGVPAAQAALFPIARMWQLTNTRYLLGAPEGVDLMNDLFDPTGRSLRVALRYGLGIKPGVAPPGRNTPVAEAIQTYTAVPTPQGPLAVLEFGHVLPRTRLYARWEAAPSDQAALARLRSPEFDPFTSVIVDDETPAPKAPGDAEPGAAEITSYSPKRLTIQAKASADCLLLLNDRWHPDWKVLVDGAPARLLRANFLMRAVALTPGAHTVQFSFEPPHGMLWVSVSAEIAGLGCLGWLALAGIKKSNP